MFENINWSELFPTKLSAIIFVSYMVLFINQGTYVLIIVDQRYYNTFDTRCYSVTTLVVICLYS
jgi:hypothetical protein